jgi:hypothetical protein
MAPQDKQSVSEISVKKEDAALLQLNTLKKNIPADCFVKSLPTALGYAVTDMAMWIGLTYAMWQFTHSEMYQSFEFWQQVNTP